MARATRAMPSCVLGWQGTSSKAAERFEHLGYTIARQPLCGRSDDHDVHVVAGPWRAAAIRSPPPERCQPIDGAAWDGEILRR